jgi:DNA-binding transcriptional ArsR family regulator
MAIFHAQLPVVFGALADPTRLAVVERLVSGPASVSELGEPFDMAGPSFLKHLKVLEDAGVVTSTKAGRVRTVMLAPEALGQVETWLKQHRRGWERRLDDLGTFLKEDKQS